MPGPPYDGRPWRPGTMERPGRPGGPRRVTRTGCAGTPLEDPASNLSLRLRTVQGMVRRALDEAPAGSPMRIVSLCAGQGRDVIDVVAEHRGATTSRPCWSSWTRPWSPSPVTGRPRPGWETGCG